MINDIKFKFICDECSTIIKDDEVFNKCVECEEKFADSFLKRAVLGASKERHEWEEKGFNVGFKRPEDEDIYLRGIKRGYTLALFNILEYPDEGVSFFEEKIGWHLEK